MVIVDESVRLSSEEEVRRDLMAFNRIQKEQSPFTEMTDLGICLNSEEEAEVRAYAVVAGVDFDRCAEEFHAEYRIVEPQDKSIGSLAANRIIPADHLAFALKVYINARRVCW